MKYYNFLYESAKDKINRAEKIARDIQIHCVPFLKEWNPEYFVYRQTRKVIFDIQEIVPRKNRQPLDTPVPLHNYFNKLFKKIHGWPARSEGVFAMGSGIVYKSFGTTYLFFPIGNYEYLWSPEVIDLYDQMTDFEKVHNIDLARRKIARNKQIYDDYKKELGPNTKQGYWSLDSNGNTRTTLSSTDFDKVYEDDTLAGYYINTGNKNAHISSLYWISKIDLVKWYNSKIKKVMEKEAINIVKSYIDTGLNEALKKEKVEIMFKCESYFLVEETYQPLLYKLLK